MKIIHSRPPNFDAIAKVFPQAFGRNVLFAFGDAIYAPFVNDVPLQLIAHEAVHGQRQLAHREEYAKLCEISPNRGTRRRMLAEIAKRLASPLYGRMVTFNQAKEDLLA